MSIQFKGTVGPQLILEEPYYDPDTGDGLRREWKGSRSAIYGLIPSVSGLAWDIRKESGPLYVLSAKFPSWQIGGQETVTLRVNVVTEILDRDIWTHPNVTGGLDGLSLANKVQFKKDVLGFVEDNDTDTYNTNWLGTAQYDLGNDIIDELQKGAESYQDETISIRMVLSFDSTGNAPPQPIYSTRLIYSTAQLPLPDGVKFTLPNTATMTNVTGSVWGWKLRAQESEYDGAKVVQTFEFTLAQWSTFLYTVSTGNFTFA